jgi:hypothetical protein
VTWKEKKDDAVFGYVVVQEFAYVLDLCFWWKKTKQIHHAVVRTLMIDVLLTTPTIVPPGIIRCVFTIIDFADATAPSSLSPTYNIKRQKAAETKQWVSPFIPLPPRACFILYALADLILLHL